MRVRVNWGVAVATFYTVFALSTVGFVVFAMGRQVDLVSEDYYARALAHDQRAQAIANADALGSAVGASVVDDRVEVRVPASMAAQVRGNLTLYRAADADADRTIAFVPEPDGRQAIPLAGLAPGHWQLQMQWVADGRDYYAEHHLRIP